MSTFFLTCTVLGGVVIIAQLVLSALGMGKEVADHDGAQDGLQLFSVRAVTAAVAFFGVGGLGARALGWPTPVAVILGATLGAGAMIAVAATMRAILNLQRDGTVHIAAAVGQTAVVYLPVPAALSGVGKVTLTLQGRTVEYQAVTPEGNPLPTGASVVVVEVRDHDTVEVVSLPSVDGVL